MPRTEGLYATTTVTEIPDGGQFKVEVLDTSQVVVASVPLAVQNGSATIDVTAAAAALWPDDARFRLVATTPAGRTTSKFLENGLGGIDFQRNNPNVAANDPVHTLVGFDIVARYLAYTKPVIDHTPTQTFTTVSALLAQLNSQYDHGGAVYTLDAGTYNITSEIEMQVKNCIVTTDSANPAAIVGGGDRSGASGSSFGFLLDNCVNTEVSNFAISGMRYHGIAVGREDDEPGGSNNRILCNQIASCGTSAIAVRNGADGSLIEGNTGSQIGSGDTRGEFIYLGLGNDADDGNLTNHVTNTTIRGNTAFDINAEALDIKRNCRGVLVEYNHFYNISVKSQGAITCLIDISDTYQADYDADVTIRYNNIHDVTTRDFNGDGIVVGLGSALVYGNVVYNCAGIGIVGYSDFDGPNKDLTIEANIVWNNTGGDIVTNATNGNGTSSNDATVTRTKNYVSANAIGDETTTAQFVGPFPATSITAFSPSQLFSIVEDGQTLTSATQALSVSGANAIAGYEFDLWWSLDPNEPDQLWNDPHQSVVFNSLPGTFEPFQLPTNGETLYFRLYGKPVDGQWSTNPIATATCTAATIAAPTGNDLAVVTYKLNSLTAALRNMFGVATSASQNYTPINIGPVTRTVSNNAEAQAAADEMVPGDVTRILPGSNIGTVVLTGSSGSPSNRKMFIGDSSATDAAGAATLSNGFFVVFEGADNWGIANCKFAPSSTTWFANVSGANFLFYDNRVEGSTALKFVPKGTRTNPTTTGARIIGNYVSGAYNTIDAIHLAAPYTGVDAPALYDCVIAHNHFKDFTATPDDLGGDPYYASSIQDISWFYNAEFGEFGKLPAGKTYIEFAHNWHENCIDESVMSKSDYHWIHDNLFEFGNGAHISLRSGDHKLVTRNIIFTNGVFGIQVSGLNCSGYYNVIVSTSPCTGLSFSYTSQYREAPGMWARRMQMIGNNWKYNFSMNLNGTESIGYIQMVMDGNTDAEGNNSYSLMPSYPPKQNDISDNFNCGTPQNISFDGPGSSLPQATQTEWDNHNPGSAASDQLWGASVGNNTWQLPSAFNVPGSVITSGLWKDGQVIQTDLPPWIGQGTDKLIQTT